MTEDFMSYMESKMQDHYEAAENALEASERERKEALETLRLIQKRYDRLVSVCTEFIKDWKKGDFELCTLAACDARAIEEVILENRK